MTCFYPISAYRVAGQKKLAFSRPPGHSGAELKIGCGRCIGCRLFITGSMADRMMHEKALHDPLESWFGTFTQDEAHLPRDGSLVPRDFQLFLKRLRKAQAPKKLRFVNCGEYGERFSRPHYHSVLFGVRIPDLQEFKRNERGELLYTSDWLSKIWGRGFVSLGAVTPESCRYVASYMLRDVNAKRPGHYDAVDPDTGEVFARVPPFARYSTHPGIGAGFLDKYFSDVFPRGHLIVDGGKHPVPRYYLEKLKVRNPEMYAKLKAERESFVYSDVNKRESRPERLAVRETVKRAQIKSGKRGGAL